MTRRNATAATKRRLREDSRRTLRMHWREMERLVEAARDGDIYTVFDIVCQAVGTTEPRPSVFARGSADTATQGPL